ncbi:MAG: AhpC/TSA family protein [Acidimicrobiia bacterium]
MPCRDMLSQLREAHHEIVSLGAGALAVATGADFQAQQLMRDGLPFPALLDPDKNLYRALGIPRIPWDQWVRPSTWRLYFRSIRRARQGRPTGDILQAPGIVVLDAGGTIRYLHRGTTLGDYPPLAEVIEALRAVVAT